jgi:hypothetical protein
VVCQPRQDAGNNSRCAGRFGDLQGAVEGGEAFLQTALTMEQVEGAVVQPGPGVIGRRRGLLEQPQRLLDQRQPDGGPSIARTYAARWQMTATAARSG